jgi:tetratricopeptide (TPR) repeat protein
MPSNALNAPFEYLLLRDQGRANQLAGMSEQARRAYTEALALRPEDELSAFFFAEVLLEQGDLASGAQLLRSTASDQQLLSSTLALIRAGETGRAIRVFDLLREAKPEFAPSTSEAAVIAHAYAREGKLSEAMALLTAQLRRAADPQDRALAAGTMGEIARDEGDWPAATRWFEQAVADAPQLVGWHTNLANAYIATGDLVRARAQVESALSLAQDPASTSEIRAGFGALLRGEAS